MSSSRGQSPTGTWGYVQLRTRFFDVGKERHGNVLRTRVKVEESAGVMYLGNTGQKMKGVRERIHDDGAFEGL